VQGITTITPATLTGSEATNALDISQTWNTTGTPTAIKLNITDTASGINSLLMQLQVGGSNIFRFRKTGDLRFGAGTSGIYPQISNEINTGFDNGLSFRSSMFNASGFEFSFINGQGARTLTSGINGFVTLQSQPFSPTSGTATWTNLLLSQTINQTGGANGITRGLFIQPTLTSAADWRAIEVANGITILGASTTAKASLRIPSGTAPTTPVNGDIWFDGTDIKMQIGGVTKTFTLT
jgi:hypothetical protein